MSFDTTDYVARISVATPVQLVTISHEVLLHHLETAKQTKDKALYDQSLAKASGIIQNLIDSLDFSLRAVKSDREIQDRLLALYIYSNGLLIQASFSKKVELLDEVFAIFTSLLEGWQIVEQSDTTSTAVMENTQQVYAGLTYRKGRLDEYIDEDVGRGFKA